MKRLEVRQTWEKLNKVRLIWCTLGLFFVIGLFILFIELTKKRESHDVTDVMPCPYLNSIDISDGVRQSNGSIKYNNVMYPKELYTVVDFKLDFDNNGTPHYANVRPYYRGCLCNITRCMMLCYEGDGTKNCKANVPHEAIRQELNQEYHFDYQYVNEKSCFGIEPYKLDEEEFELVDGDDPRWYDIDEDGNIDKNKYEKLHHKTFYVAYNIVTKEKQFYQCENEFDFNHVDLHASILPYFMFISVAFIIITFLVYIFLPELRNLHGKCLMCYLLSLAIGFTLMGSLYINGNRHIEEVACHFIGYFMYFSFQVAFFWLNVICFDLWWHFRRTSGFIISERKRFGFYSIYAWGSALFLTLLILLLDRTKIPEYLKPGVGYKQCYLDTEFLPRFLYFYLPMLILCTLNIVFFSMTAIKIRHHQMEMKKIVSKDECRKHRKKLEKEKDNVTLFLRLFIVMGGCWCMEGISFIVASKSPYFFLFDVWNCSSGILIFICMVVKRRVFRLMKKKYRRIISRSISTESQDPATHSSTMTGDPRANMRLQRLTSNISNISATRSIY